MESSEYLRMNALEETMWWYRGLHRLISREVLGRVPKGARVLDAGCGTGGLMRHLLRNAPGLAPVGVDLAEEGCRLAVAKTAAPAVVGSVMRLPFRDGAFAAMTSLDVLCHGRVDPPTALAEMRRCLAAGGVLVVNLPAYQWMLSAHDRRVHNTRRFTAAEASALLAAAGFRVVRRTYWNTLLFPLMALRRKLLSGDEGRSDVMAYPWLVDRLCRAALAFERAWLGLGLSLPFGGSVLAVAVKHDA